MVRPDLGNEGRLRHLAKLELVNGLSLLALALLVSALAFSPAISIALAAVFLACGASAFWLRRRVWSAIELEVGRRRQAEQEARDAHGAKGRFLADLSHEIRTPLTGILGLSDLLLQSGLPLSHHAHVKLIRTSAEALLSLTDDIVDLSRIDAGRFRLRPRELAMPGEHRRRARGSRRILVVDDRAANRWVVELLLIEMGYESALAESGEQALALLAAQHFDAVLLDREMPGLDGAETCRRLRRREGSGRRTPVIAVTAHTQPEVQEDCRAAGMDGYLAKPFRAEELAAMLDRWTGIDAADAVDTADGLEERLAAFRALPAGDGPDMGTQVIAEFLRQGENDLATMRHALRQRDGAALADTAHALAGSAALLGARDLAESASELARLARGGDLDACAARLPRVEREYQDAARRMQ